MIKKPFDLVSDILDYSLDSAWCGSADIAHFVRGDFIPIFLQSMRQGSQIFVVMQFRQFLE